METNKEAKKAYRRAYYLAHKEKSIAQSKAYRAAHKEQVDKYGSEYGKLWRSKNFERKRSNQLTYNYGISAGEYDSLLKAQNNVCAICAKPESIVDPRTKKVWALCVDHNHETGAVRGLLCRGCNSALGMFSDNLSRVESAAAYLRKYEV